MIHEQTIIMNTRHQKAEIVLNPVESDILNQALLSLKEEAGLDLVSDADSEIKQPKGNEADFIIETPERTLVVEVKRNLRPAHLGAIIQQIKALKPIGLLVADYINPKIAKTLKDEGIQYLDACGNSYLNLPPLFIHISGQKPETDFKRETNIAFEMTGLKLIFGLLCNTDLINASYREISQQTGVALGAIGPIFTGLQEAGYLINPGKADKRKLIKRRKLMERWVEAYPEKLRPKLLVGVFTSADNSWWNTLDLTRYGAYWGGEVGAAKYTGYLKPQQATVYLPEAAGNKLFATAKLRKASTANETGIIHIYRPFWPDVLSAHSPNLRPDTVHPILIYADLIATQDSRNLETAKILYDEAIVGFIGED